MKRLAIAAATALLALFYRFCRLFPVKRQVVCISRQSDDAPIDFLLLKEELSREEPPYRTVMLANKLESPLRYVPVVAKQVFFMATSRAIILDSYCIAVSLLGERIKAPVVQIWHALGNMKKFGYAALDTPEGHSSETARLMHMHEGYDAVAVSSLNFRDDLAAGFNVDPSIVFEAPLPRVDLLRDPQFRSEQRDAFLQDHPEMAGKKTIAYCPTFRKTPAPNEKEAMRSLLSAVDFDRFNFVYMPHPVSRQALDDPRIITATRSGADPLFAADYVITDYSTVMYEAGLMDVPVYLYAYDWDTYHEKRSFNIDLARDVPTLFTNDAAAIATAIDLDQFDEQAFARFTESNIATLTGESATQHLTRRIIALAEEQPPR